MPLSRNSSSFNIRGNYYPKAFICRSTNILRKRRRGSFGCLRISSWTRNLWCINIGCSIAIFVLQILWIIEHNIITSTSLFIFKYEWKFKEWAWVKPSLSYVPRKLKYLLIIHFTSSSWAPHQYSIFKVRYCCMNYFSYRSRVTLAHRSSSQVICNSKYEWNAGSNLSKPLLTIVSPTTYSTILQSPSTANSKYTPHFTREKNIRLISL
jgi:hypothetical protein